MNIESLLYDCLVRVPNIQIILRGDSYFLLDGIEYTHKISSTNIDELLSSNLIKKRSNGSISFTDEAVTIAHNIKLQSHKVESKKHKGYFYDAFISPPKFIP